MTTEQQSDGWPGRPEGRPGREATRGCTRREQLHRNGQTRALCQTTGFPSVEPAWRGFLSLRDPTGATHAVGPPEIVPGYAQLTDALKKAWALTALICAMLPAPLLAAGAETSRRAHDLQLTIDSRWAGGANGGYYPLRIGLQNLARPRVLDFVYSDAGGPGSKTPSVSRQVQIDQNASLQFSLSIPLVSAGAYGQLRVLENGRELDELTQHVSLPEAQSGQTEVPSLLVISLSPATVDCARFEDAIQALAYSPIAATGRMLIRSSGAVTGMRSNDFQVIGPQLLPESWIDYSALDIVAISLVALEKISPEARGALVKWAATGGTLVIYDVGSAADSSTDLARLLDVANQPPQLRKWHAADPQLHRPIILSDDSAMMRGVAMRTVPLPAIAAAAPDPEVDEQEQPAFIANQAVWPVAPEAFSRLDLLAGQVFAFPGNPFPGAPVDWAWWITSAKPSHLKWTSRHGMSSRQQHPEFSTFLIPGVGAVPLLAFVVLISIFAIVIGPVNYFLVWRRKQLYLLVLTIPTIAFVTSAALFGYSVFSDGFGVQSRLRSFTMLDQYSKTAVSWNRISLYAGMTSSAGLKFSPDTAVLPVWRDPSGFESGSVDWTNTQHWTRGWLQSQKAAQFETIALRAERGRVDVKPAGPGEVEVANGMAWEIDVLLVIDDAGRAYTGRKLPAGGIVRLAEARPEDLAALSRVFEADQLKAPPGAESVSLSPFSRLRPRTWVPSYGEPQMTFSASQLETGLKLLTKPAQATAADSLRPRTYLALVSENPGIELGIESTRATAGLHVVLGFY